MQAIVETGFDAIYLILVITIGIRMIRGCKGNKQYRLFGIMAVVLGAGDAFHLIPRALALCTTGLENYTVPLGLGKWITSITMTIFYALSCMANALPGYWAKRNNRRRLWPVGRADRPVHDAAEPVVERGSPAFLGDLPQRPLCVVRAAYDCVVLPKRQKAQ